MAGKLQKAMAARGFKTPAEWRKSDEAQRLGAMAEKAREWKEKFGHLYEAKPETPFSPETAPPPEPSLGGPEMATALHVMTPSTQNGRDYAERALQEYLVNNLESLGILEPRLIATEYQTEVGRIDILLGAGESEDEIWVVELKAGIAGRDAIGQIISYMGAIEAKFPEHFVLGMLIAADFDKACLGGCPEFCVNGV